MQATAYRVSVNNLSQRFIGDRELQIREPFQIPAHGGLPRFV